MKQAPKISKFDTFKTVGFYDYLAIQQCILKGMWHNINYIGSFPEELPMRHMLIGLFHHRVMELSYTSKTLTELQQGIELSIKEIQNVVDRWSHLRLHGSVSGWNEVNLSASSAIKTFKNKIASSGCTKVHTEESLHSNNGMLNGRPDFFIIENDIAYLKDFKSTSIRDEDSQVKKDYVEQIQYYAVLLFENYTIRYVDGNVVSLYKDDFRVVISKDESELYKEKVVDVIDRANAEITRAKDIFSLANPSCAACESCKKKIICHPYKKQQQSLNLRNDGYILEGKLISYDLNDISLTFEVSIYDVWIELPIKIKVPFKYRDELIINTNYIITDIKCVNDSYVWTSKSRFFIND